MKYALPIVMLLLSGCGLMQQIEGAPAPDTAQSSETANETPPENARTVEDFDTTTAAERTAAASPSTGGRRLGEAVATLGDPTLPGFWVMTDLVDTDTPGRVTYPAGNASVEVTLMPTTNGSARISLAALRVLNAPLTDLVTLDVFAN